MSNATDKPAAPATITSIAALTAAYPQLCADIASAARLEGAAAERTRILGIEANALPGHEQLVAEMKADPNVSPDQAAGRILGAERALRGNAAQAIRDVETHTGSVRAAPAAAHTPAVEAATTPDAWKAEYAKSTELQAEFGSAEAYVAFRQGIASGTVRILRTKAG